MTDASPAPLAARLRPAAAPAVPAREALDVDWDGLVGHRAATGAPHPTEPFGDLGLLNAVPGASLPMQDRAASATAAGSWRAVDRGRLGAGRAAPARDEADRPDPGTTLCDNLHAEFTRAMHDPAFATGLAAWAEVADAAPALPATLDDLARAADARRPLLDVLATETDTETGPDAVLARYAHDGEHDLYAPPRPVDVLQLFAPVSARSPAPPATLPSQARGDQHRWSLDTCLDGRVGTPQVDGDG